MKNGKERKPTVTLGATKLYGYVVRTNSSLFYEREDVYENRMVRLRNKWEMQERVLPTDFRTYRNLLTDKLEDDIAFLTDELRTRARIFGKL